MTWINSTSKEWYVNHDWHFGGVWTEPKDYPSGMEAEKDELGAIIAPDGTVKNRIRQICITKKYSLETPRQWQT